jgi:3-phosphoglycerate kinase
MSAFRTLDNVALSGKRALVRVDLNVPMENGRVTDATRLERIVPTLKEISDKGGKVVLLAHFGRPKGDTYEARASEKESLAPVAAALAGVLGKPVAFCPESIGPRAAAAVAAMKDGDVLCLENTRFHKGEEKNAHGPHHASTIARSRRRTRLRRARLQHQQHGAGAGHHGGGRCRRRAGDHPGLARRAQPTPTTSCSST